MQNDLQTQSTMPQRNIWRLIIEKSGPLNRSIATFMMALLLVVFDVKADNEAAGKFYEDAVQSYRKGENQAAIINLKNALQENPELLSAYTLLGEIYLKEKNLIAAEVALSKAADRGVDKALIVRQLSQLYLYQIKYGQLLKEIDPSRYSPSIQPELYVFRGHAYLQLGKLDKAFEAYSKAATLDPASVEPTIGRANVLLRKNDFEGAALYADQAILMAPDNADTWFIKASIKHAKYDLNNALNDYDKALQIDPEHLDARLARA